MITQLELIKCMMDYTKLKSKFTKESIYWTIPWGVFVLILSQILFINVIIKKYLIEDVNVLKLLFGSLLLVGLPILFIRIMKIRYYVLTHNYLRYYSILYPFGRKLYWKNYIGKIILTEKGSQGSYSVVYLVDKNSKTAFKIVGLHYKKFGEIINAIPLRKMDYSPSTCQYFKLLFFERIKITETGSNPVNDRSVNKVLNAIQVFAVIGVGLFVLGMIVKMIAKLGG